LLTAFIIISFFLMGVSISVVNFLHGVNQPG